MIRVALIDDQQLFRESLSNLLNSISNVFTVQSFAGAEEFLDFLQDCRQLPEIVLLDLEMPGMNGIDLNNQLQKKYPQIKVIILSVHANEKLIASMIRSGADGYLTKNCDKEELIKAVQNVHEQGYYINKKTMQAIQQNSFLKKNTLENVNGLPIELSKRETEILQLICKEHSNTEIAAHLFLSVRTVEGHRNSILQKTGCRNTAGLVLFAVRHQLCLDIF